MDIIKPSKALFLPPEAGLITSKLPGPGGLGIWAKWEIELRDGDKLLSKREGPSHSFVRNFGKVMRGLFRYTDLVNESLTERLGSSYFVKIKTNATATGTGALNTAASRIRFGNSAAALDSTQVDLQGALLGTFGAVTTSLTGSGESTTGTTFKCEGQITNITGSPFTVQEMGLYSLLANEAGVGQDTLLLRDLTGATIVADTLTILARWSFSILV